MKTTRQYITDTFRNLVLFTLPLVVAQQILQFDIDIYLSLLIGIAFGILEAWILWKWTFPWVGEIVSGFFYSSHSNAGEDIEVEAARQLEQAGDIPGACRILEHYAETHKGFMRAWDMYISFLIDPMEDYVRAIEVLEKCSRSRRWNREDRAFFLYRIGKIYKTRLNRPDKAAAYWRETAKRYPKTAFGREAANKL
ncbi:hypothetical protein QET93_008865 [Akkermansia sp. N21116]|uniref:tetratricopeptide repeat protein n=1 Tax=Akkermansia sp. N21116 TaxID=3040764 RepID=UPI00244EC9F0|nr:tetratricopeptide repeat protein [Akkermansia sp. N21116]WPX39645.1 hypothetical protein QET93_008865 [Akkermansia sp. N21116]